MKRSRPPAVPGVIPLLVDGAPEHQQAWLDQAAAVLSPETLRLLERQACAYIDERYPDDPGSLVNFRHVWGEQVKKRQVRARFDRAHEQLLVKQLEHNSALLDLVLAEHQTRMRDALYAERRPSSRQRQRDERKQRIQDILADDLDLQGQLARDRAAHKRAAALVKLQAQIDRKATRLTAQLEEARRRLDRPHELHVKLIDVLTEMMKYHRSLNDRALRYPSLADRLKASAWGLKGIMETLEGSINELNALGDNPPDPEQLRHQREALLELLKDDLDQWRTDAKQEPEL